MIAKGNQAIIEDFTTACETDARVVAAFIGGSYATGRTDEYSDLDLYLITAEEAYDSFFADRIQFIQQLGKPVFLQDFNGFGFDMVVFILADGTEGELALATERKFDHIHGGPFKVLVDKKEILAEAKFPLQEPSSEEQQASLRRLIWWFWRDVSLFTTAIARGRLWTAYGYLENARLKCVNLARLKRNFAGWADGYEKLEQAVEDEDIAPLHSTLCPLSRPVMLEAVGNLVRFYRETASSLAQMHSVAYPADLDRFLSDRLQDMTEGL
jgi:predicted nucleotidyltransferase